ncbi:MAG: hypothetical protein PVF73_00230, partial [Bacteroidales bacterium]
FYDFIFSSNRNSMGNDFDILLFPVSIAYPYEEDVLTISVSSGTTTGFSFFKSMLEKINTSDNEFGPYTFNCNLNSDPGNSEYLFLYAREESNNLNLCFVVNEPDPTGRSLNGYIQTGPYNVEIINTDIYNEGYISVANDKIYYCSDKEGNFNIYQKDINNTVNLVDFLTQPYEQGDKIDILSSDEQDKCPYVADSFMVFTSNRQGGSGGFDLYYSKLSNGEWSEPQNFGSTINSEYDEYRPIVRLYKTIPNDLMIFSSNREGGLGGYDLYYLGITETR